jgi:flagellar hook-associated protein 2
VELQLSGLASGFDWMSMVDQLTDLERIPQQRLLLEQSDIFDKNTTYKSLQTELTVLQSRLESLVEDDLFDQRQVSVSDETVADAEVSPGAAQGNYDITISKLATSTKTIGTSDVGGQLNATSDVSGLLLSEAPFRNAINDGSFTVNGKRIDITTSQSLQDVFDAISAATSGSVTGSYDPVTDKIQLSSGSEIILGSSNDTTNFLQEAELFNNGTGTIDSSNALGKVQTDKALVSGNFSTPISDGGAGTGSFKINGVSISFDASSDSLTNVMDRINASGAGVIATYDATNDRIQLSNTTTGDLGVSMEDLTGNFLAATGISAGTVQRGDNMEFSINGGGTQVSYSNTASEVTTGIAGLSVTGKKLGTTSVNVDSDRTAIEKGINDFIDQFNKVQAFIETHTSSSTDTFGKVNTGILYGENFAESIASKLRSIVVSEVSGLDAAMNHLSEIGISSSGYDNNLSVEDSDLLSEALTDSLSQIKTLFQDSTSGIGVQLLSYIDQQIGEDGDLIEKQDRLTEQSTDIDDQIERMESFVQMRREQLISSFVSMEQAQQQINQQMSFLSSRLGVSTGQ